MLCPVCASPSAASALCTSCAAMTEKVEALPYVHVCGGGSSRTQVRDRQWLYKHAREVLAKDSTIADLTSIRDRMPHSQGGKTLRKKLNKAIARQSETFNPMHAGALNA